MKLCIDCKYFINKHDGTFFAECQRTDTQITIETTDLVDGKVSKKLRGGMNYCSGERRYGWLESRLKGKCGIEGRYWEKLNG